MSDASSAHNADYGSNAYRAYVLGALSVIYMLNAVDRILVAIVQEPMKAELQLSDFQLGLLGGPAFALFYTFMGIPIARYAERKNRITIIALGAAAWSAATAACGFAQNYAQLLFARIWVGIGEAACVPPSHSAISDIFPSKRRALALAIYGMGVPIGTVAAAIGGGWLAQHMDWRMAFWALGPPGILAALVLKLTVKEPARKADASPAPSFGATLKALSKKPSFWHMATGGALVAVFSYAFSQFLPSYLIRNYALDISTASYTFAIVSGLCPTIGIFLSGFLADRLAPRHPKVLTWLPALGLAIATPMYALALLQGSLIGAFAILLVAPIFHLFWFGPLFAVTQHVAEPRMRATASALTLSLFNLVGYGLGPPLVGALADHFTGLRLSEIGLAAATCAATPHLDGCASAGAFGLRYALICALVFMLWAAIHFWLAGRTLQRDRVD